MIDLKRKIHVAFIHGFTTGCENKIFVRKTTFSPEVEYQDQNVGFYVI